MSSRSTKFTFFHDYKKQIWSRIGADWADRADTAQLSARIRSIRSDPRQLWFSSFP